MSKRLKVKVAALIVIALASLVAMGVLLTTMQDKLSVDNYTYDIQQEMDELPGLLESADAEKRQTVTTYDDIYRSKAESVAFMANNDAGFEATDAKMAEYKELLDVTNIMVVERGGTVVAKAQDTLADFSYDRYNQLRTCFDTGEPSEAVEVELRGEGGAGAGAAGAGGSTNAAERWFRYYAAAIDADRMVVVEQEPSELYQLIQDTGSVESVLRTITVGAHGYVFAVSAQDYLIDYHPREDLMGADALDAGIKVEDLEDGAFEWMTLDGTKLYCGVSKIGSTYYISAVPESDMVSSRNITVGVTLFVFFAVMTVVIMYGIFVLREDERRAHDAGSYANMGPLRFNKTVGKKAAALSFIGFLAVLLISFYMQTLFALSSESVSGSERADDMADTLARYDAQTETITQQYSDRYLNKCQVAAYILDANPELNNREKLQELADVLQIQYVFTFDSAGIMEATNSSFTNFVISEDPADQSYEFRQLLYGVEQVIQEPGPDEISGELRQYIGVTLHDASGEADGFVQVGIRPERLENMLANVQLDSILDGVKVGTGGFAFAVNKADHTFAYYPEQRLIGRAATEYGMADNQFKDGYSDYITVDGERYFASSLETADQYIYIAQPEDELMTERVPLTTAVGILSFACQLIIFLVLSFSRKGTAEAQVAASADGEPRTFDMVMPDGRVAKTESATSRWLNKSLKWDEKTAEQKTLAVVRWLVALFAVAVCVGVMFKDDIFGQNSIFSYILSGNWEKGLTIFAFTMCIMVVCVALTAVMVIRYLLKMLSGVFGARGETVCRLISSFIKYATVIGILYYCLALFGVDTATLLASAGILSIAISFGAKELVSDIISGLFIIFEGEFRVGDIISVGGKTGTVMEIGVRTTKIEDGSANVIIIRNSEVSDVVNMTKKSSLAVCEVGIEYGESLERVESVLEKEFANIRRRLPAIEDGPFYKGVVALADNSVNIRIVAQCAEGSRGQLERDLRREMKLIFDEYDISIPFPQVVVNQPKEYREATIAEQLRAERFNEEQKAAAKDIGNEEDDDR